MAEYASIWNFIFSYFVQYVPRPRNKPRDGINTTVASTIRKMQTKSLETLDISRV